MVIASLFFGVAYLFSPQRHFPKTRSVWIKGSIFGILGLAIPMTAFITSLKYQSSGVTSLMITLNPVVTTIFAPWFLEGEQFTLRKGIGSLLAFAGAGLILLSGENGLSSSVQFDWHGAAWVLFGVFFYAGGIIFARRSLANEDSFNVASIRMFSGAIFLVPLALGINGFALGSLNGLGWAAMAYSGVVGTFLAFLLELFIIRRYGATDATQASYVTPLVATCLGTLLLGEKITLVLVAGMFIIFGGLYLLQRPKQISGIKNQTMSLEPVEPQVNQDTPPSTR
jgi:probable blue pigment (indigoidine) exporter